MLFLRQLRGELRKLPDRPRTWMGYEAFLLMKAVILFDCKPDKVQRLALAQALLPATEVLLLDEPTDGLDPEGIKWFRDFVLRLRNERGRTVLVNSHLLAEVELMCDRVAILREGKRMFEGQVGGLHDDALVFEVYLDPWGTACGLIASTGGEILGPNRICLRHGSDPAALVETLVRAGVRVRAFSPVRRSLEDFYMELLDGAGSPN